MWTNPKKSLMENFFFCAVGAFRILCSKYSGIYDFILNKSGKSAMEVKQSKKSCTGNI